MTKAKLIAEYFLHLKNIVERENNGSCIAIGSVPTLTLVSGLRIAEKASWLRSFSESFCATRGN